MFRKLYIWWQSGFTAATGVLYLFLGNQSSDMSNSTSLYWIYWKNRSILYFQPKVIFGNLSQRFHRKQLGMILHDSSYTSSHSSPPSVWITSPGTAVILSVMKTIGYRFHTSKSVATHFLLLILWLSKLSDTYLLRRMQKAPPAAAATMTTTHATTIPAMQPAEHLIVCLFVGAKQNKTKKQWISFRLKIMQFHMNTDIIRDFNVPHIC